MQPHFLNLFISFDITEVYASQMTAKEKRQTCDAAQLHRIISQIRIRINNMQSYKFNRNRIHMEKVL